MNFKKTLTLAFGLAALVGAPLMAADVYNFDGAHSSIAFEVVHLGIFKAHGTFDKFDGALNYDAKNPAKSSVNVSIDPASINTRNEMRDKHLRSEDFFFVEKNPTASFKSTKFEVGKEGALKVTGDLTLRGVTKSVVLDSVITGTATDDWGNERIGFEGRTSVNRKDFGIAWNKVQKSGAITVAEKVDIIIQGEGIKAKAAEAKPAEKDAKK